MIRPSTSALVIFIALCFASRPLDLQAGTIFSGNSSSSLTVSGVLDAGGNALGALPIGLDVGYQSLYFELVDTTGSGFATATSSSDLNGTAIIDFVPYQLNLGDSVAQQLNTSGGTIAPGDFAFSGAAFLSDITISNSTIDSFTLQFGYSLAYAINSQVDDPLTEYAFSFEAVLVADLASSGGPLVDLSDLVEFTASSSGGGPYAFDITVAPGESRDITLIHINGGDPRTAIVPEPSATVLCLTGILSLVVIQRLLRQARRPQRAC